MKVRDEVFQHYFYFMEERMNIFWKRYNGEPLPFTNDPILSNYKFTNVYRILDRVSQYLVKKVIYNSNKSLNEIDTLLRIIVFKIFNNIQTWEFLEEQTGPISTSNFDVLLFSKLLSEKIKTSSIFNGAYIMNGSHKKYNYVQYKHEKWLLMVQQEMLVEKRFERICRADSLEQLYEILQECTFIGSFLAYQFAIDINYSNVVSFSENSFVKAGIGAIRGIKKCFPDAKKTDYENCIRYTQDHLPYYREKYNLTGFNNLFNREPTLIDLQNCFCETDKYLRVKMPDLKVDNTKIKQKFTNPKPAFNYFFPPKWGLDNS